MPAALKTKSVKLATPALAITARVPQNVSGGACVRWDYVNAPRTVRWTHTLGPAPSRSLGVSDARCVHIHPGDNPGAHRWFLESTPIQTLPPGGSILARSPSDLPLSCLQGDSACDQHSNPKLGAARAIDPSCHARSKQLAAQVQHSAYPHAAALPKSKI